MTETPEAQPVTPIARDTPTFPTIQAITSAAITNGITMMPTTDTARMNSTGPVSNMTSNPASSTLSGLAATVSAQARTARSKKRPMRR